MYIVAFSDTHGCHDYVTPPDGDILMFAGDLCAYGHNKEVKGFGTWLGALSHKHKIVIAGNHDWPFQNNRGEALSRLPEDCIYLHDSSVEIDGIKIYGSPWQPEFCDWAFNLKRGKELKEKWDKIPNDTDILVTHGPPAGIKDGVHGIPVGCADLYDAVQRVKPRYHIFGHIHAGYGAVKRNDTVYMNVSICDDYNRKQNDPMWFDYETGEGFIWDGYENT